jgi:hypothetical protein
MPKATDDHTTSPEPTGDRGRSDAQQPKPETNPPPSRRALLGGGAGVAGPDAELIRLCSVSRGHDAMQRHMDAHARQFTDEAAADMCGRWMTAVDAIARTPATTRAGLVAKAAAARHEAFAWALANDVLRVVA